MSQLHRRAFRSVFLITYSQANMALVPTRGDFVRFVTNAVESATPAQLLQWVCSQEAHADGGLHYHMAVKLDRQQRWLAIRDRLQIREGIRVNFQDQHTCYYDAWKYVTKEDAEPISSPGHPDLRNEPPPRTLAALRARRHAGDEPPAKKPKRLRVIDIATIITSKGIKSYLELMALSKVQKDEGKNDLYEYILTKGLLHSFKNQFISQSL